MKVSPLAGQPAPASMLVNVPRLVTAYYAEHPTRASRRERVAFGTSGHRGSSFARSFNEAHILAITQAICAYRQTQRIDGPLFIGMDTHALSEPAFVSALEVLAANGVEVMIDRDRGYTPTPVISHAILGYNRGRQPAWRTASSSRPRTTRPRTAASSTTRRPAARPTPTITGLDRADRQPLLTERPARRPPHALCPRAPRRDHAPARLHHAVRGRPGERRRHGRHPRRRRAHRRRPARRRRRALLGADHRELRPRGHRGQRRGRPDVPLHDPGLGRQDPHGLLVAVRDGAARRRCAIASTSRSPTTPTTTATASSRRSGLDESQSLSGGRDLLPVPAPAGLAGRRRGRQDRGQQRA